MHSQSVLTNRLPCAGGRVLSRSTASSTRCARVPLIVRAEGNGSNGGGHQGPPPAWPGRAVAPETSTQRSGPKVFPLSSPSPHPPFANLRTCLFHRNTGAPYPSIRARERPPCQTANILELCCTRCFVATPRLASDVCCCGGRRGSPSWEAPAPSARRRWKSCASSRRSSRSWRWLPAPTWSFWLSRCMGAGFWEGGARVLTFQHS